MTQKKVRVVLTHAEADALSTFALEGQNAYMGVDSSHMRATTWAAGTRGLGKLFIAMRAAGANGRWEKNSG